MGKSVAHAYFTPQVAFLSRQDKSMNTASPHLESHTDVALRRVLSHFPQLNLALVFGSVARGTPRPDSDLDIAVASELGALKADERMDIMGALAQEIGRPIDLIDLQAASPPIATVY